VLAARVAASLSRFPVHRAMGCEDADPALAASSAASAASAAGAAGAAARELELLPRVRFGDSEAEFSAVEGDGDGDGEGEGGGGGGGGGGANGSTAERSHLRASRERARAAAYDPSFLLPALLHVCASGRLPFHARRFAAGGALSFALAATASSERGVREAAYAVLGAFAAAAATLPEAGALATARGAAGGGAGAGAGAAALAAAAAAPGAFRELPQVLLLLGCVRDSVTSPLMRMPALTAAFAAEALHVM